MKKSDVQSTPGFELVHEYFREKGISISLYPLSEVLKNKTERGLNWTLSYPVIDPSEETYRSAMNYIGVNIHENIKEFSNQTGINDVVFGYDFKIIGNTIEVRYAADDRVEHRKKERVNSANERAINDIRAVAFGFKQGNFLDAVGRHHNTGADMLKVMTTVNSELNQVRDLMNKAQDSTEKDVS